MNDFTKAELSQDPAMKTLPKGTFNKNWFMNRAYLLRSLALDHAGKPLTYVEIGVFEGSSSCWMCDNVLTHPDSRGFGIDPWEPCGKRDVKETGNIRDRAFANLKPWTDKYTIIEKPSLEVLRDGTFEPESIDILYIDGRHQSWGCILDVMNGWPLVKINGLVIFDDYMKCKKTHVYAAVHATKSVMEVCSKDWVWYGRQAACIKTGPTKEEMFRETVSGIRAKS